MVCVGRHFSLWIAYVVLITGQDIWKEIEENVAFSCGPQTAGVRFIFWFYGVISESHVGQEAM